MLETYVLQTMSGLSEPQAQRLVVESYQKNGWTVKNIHETDPRFEEGVDIVASLDSRNHLVAVKKAPVKGDLEQLERLAARDREGELFYIYLQEPTEPFRKEMPRFRGTVNFLGPAAFHKFLVEREVVSYLIHLFGNLLLTREIATSVAQIWACRNVSPSPNVRQLEDADSWWTIKDAVLKVRASLGVLATRWEDRLMSRVEVDPGEFESVLAEVVQDLDYVQRYAGGHLAETFIQMRDTKPGILSIIWKATRMGSYWSAFALPAERMASQEEVVEFARKKWIVPGSSRSSRSMMNLSTMRFFYSGLAGVVRQMAEIMSDFDHGVELAWQYGPE